MSDAIKPLAKSLHTVSVLVNVARYIMNSPGYQWDTFTAICDAVTLLGLAGKPDVYGLKTQAFNQLKSPSEG